MYQNGILRPRLYGIPNSGQQIVLTRAALEVFSAYLQQGTDPEAGGLLFAEFDFPIIRITEASLPRATDRRWRTLFIPNRMLQRQLIKQRFKKDYHFVGEWHTHPEAKPTPSALDLESMSDSFLKSRHELNYFIMVIVGNTSKNLVLWVSVHNGSNYYSLNGVNC
jgi:integrative and conjugative element protein (TIGR02256 family)